MVQDGQPGDKGGFHSVGMGSLLLNIVVHPADTLLKPLTPPPATTTHTHTIGIPRWLDHKKIYSL